MSINPGVLQLSELYFPSRPYVKFEQSILILHSSSFFYTPVILVVLVAISAFMVGCSVIFEPALEPTEENSALIEADDCGEAAVLQEDDNFDRGIRALAVRDYEKAKIYFQHHREVGTFRAQREADTGMAFVILVSESVIGSDVMMHESLDERAEIMGLALILARVLEKRLETLDAINEALSKDLEKREEALKRLRDLTLGQ